MSSKLKQIRELIESQVGFSLDEESRERPVVLARAIYYKVARDSTKGANQISLSAIGGELNKSHCTVLHALNDTSIRAMDDEYYSDIYHSVMNEVAGRKRAKRHMIESKNQVERSTQLYLENVELRNKLKKLVTYSDRFAQLTADLGEEQLEDVYKKVELMARMANA